MATTPRPTDNRLNDPLDPAAPIGMDPLSTDARRAANNSDPRVDNRTVVQSRSAGNGMLIAAVILVLAVIAYFVFANGDVDEPATETPAATDTTTTPETTAPADTTTAPADTTTETPPADTATPAPDATAPDAATPADPATPAPDAAAPADTTTPAPDAAAPAEPAPAPAPAQ